MDPRATAVPLHLGRTGGFRESAVGAPALFRGGETLEVPGSPLVLATPGHTRGSSSFCFASFGVVATGDALITADAMTGLSGPRIASRAFTHDSARALASLDAFAKLDTAIGLPGHGEPILTGMTEAAPAGTIGRRQLTTMGGHRDAHGHPREQDRRARCVVTVTTEETASRPMSSPRRCRVTMNSA